MNGSSPSAHFLLVLTTGTSPTVMWTYPTLPPSGIFLARGLRNPSHGSMLPAAPVFQYGHTILTHQMITTAVRFQSWNLFTAASPSVHHTSPHTTATDSYLRPHEKASLSSMRSRTTAPASLASPPGGCLLEHMLLRGRGGTFFHHAALLSGGL